MSFKGFSPLPPLHTRAVTREDIFIARPSSSASVSYLREAIASIDAKISLLISQRRELEGKLEQEVRMQSPVLRLPSELLSSIFIMGVLGMGDEDPVMVPTLMLVCRYWAEVALNTPLLWAKISVSPHDSLEKARRRIERSKSCPLEISINFSHRHEHGPNATDQIVSATDLFDAVLWRTKTFTLIVPSRQLAHAALTRCKSDAPILEKLTIQVHYSIQEDRHFTKATLPLFNGCTPRLRSCSITSFNFGWDLNLMARLKVLKLGGYYNGLAPSANTLLSILRQCPELEEIALRNLSDVDSNPCYSGCGDQEASLVTAQKTIHLPRLTKASFYYAGIARQIMTCISCPNLEWLELCYLENVSNVIQVLYSQALTKLPLRYLRIEMCLFNEIKFIEFLRRAQSLITLELVDLEDVTCNFLRGLSTSSPWVCPRLESVSFDGCTYIDWDALRGFVESRLPPNPPTFKRYHATTSSIVSSASEAAAALAKSRIAPRAIAHPAAQPKRIRAIDVTRCPQISKEMVQWLRMYVAEVKCESAKGEAQWGVVTT
ncbi:hypothetical protein CC1G_07133 [Coprinopsis cinerea okayama7|uniref:F-box domain-containing protein n=1 Tax=Coprinopsis cinerea (strain Okayama-7 / 130 / ATCC MYA-4618 / FGSC 9003) TaxID=240176 RepID=A8NR66_COPC7|nr:hypothetical protein CC1G_07133 [Coprinopsis cinerea okayama7\|eukprot:XP_001835709.1 hypothetical protein CC1G_07133 [Coprinopsis cinerea okayama7\